MYVLNQYLALQKKIFERNLFARNKLGWPTENDWDFSSKMYGADTVRITSDDLFWAQKGYNTSAGVVVMVAVKFSEAGNYTLMLTEASNSFH